MQLHGEIPDKLVLILRSIAIVAQQRVLADRTAALEVLDKPLLQPTTPLNRTPLQLLQAALGET